MSWLKKNWKWLILPLWAISIVLMWLFKGRSFSVNVGDDSSVVDDVMEKRDSALQAFRRRLDELARKAEKKLQDASKEQLEEYEEMKDRPLDEVAEWIDKLS